MSGYGTSTAIIDGGSKTFLEAGIHSPMRLVNVRTIEDAAVKGNPFLEYTYVRKEDVSAYKQGKSCPKIMKTEWPVNFDAKTPEDTKNLEKKRNNQMNRIFYVVSQFVKKEVYDGKVYASFEEMCSFVKKILPEEVRANVDLRLKIVNDGRWYTTPSYIKPSSMPWIERLDKVPDEATKMVMIEGIDQWFRSAEETPKSKGGKQNPFKKQDETNLLVDDGSVIGEPPAMRGSGTFEDPVVEAPIVVTAEAAAEALGNPANAEDGLPF